MFYKVRFLFDPRCVLKFKTEKGKELLSAIWDEAASRISAEKLIKCNVEFNEISIVVCNPQDFSKEDLESMNAEILKSFELDEESAEVSEITPASAVNTLKLAQGDKDYLLKFVDPSEVVQPKDSTASDAESTAPSEPDSEEIEDVFKTLDELISLDELKDWAKDIQAFTHLNAEKARMMKPILNMSYLVSINEGNGCSTVFNVMGKVIARILGRKSVEVKEITVEPDKESKAYNVKRILNDLSYIDAKADKLHVFAMRIDKFQNNNYMGAWIDLLSGLRKNSNALFIFVLPYLEKVAIGEMHARISDILPNRVLTVKPFGTADYKKFFKLYFEKLNMTVSDDALELVPEFIAAEKSDGRFYGIDTINKICDELLYEKLKSSSQSNDFTVVTKDDALSLLGHLNPEETNGESGMEKLDELVSLDEVKCTLKEIIASLKMQKAMNSGAKTSMHMMFSGPPGTGKTVVARILGQILREEKLLSAGGFYEVTRKDLVGSYVGHTAPKTAEVCHLARGSVLFIDEAYSLDGGSHNDYGKEAISTLIAEMENNRDDLVVVFAGYRKELEQLFELNPGLRDRIPYRINFSSYNRDELCSIFYKMLPKEFSYAEDFCEAVNSFFENLDEEIMESPNFSNARFVRNLAERVLSKAALRMQMNPDSALSLELTAADFSLATADSEFKNSNEKKKRIPIGF